jgi:hypothetical protein
MCSRPQSAFESRRHVSDTFVLCANLRRRRRNPSYLLGFASHGPNGPLSQHATLAGRLGRRSRRPILRVLVRGTDFVGLNFESSCQRGGDVVGQAPFGAFEFAQRGSRETDPSCQFRLLESRADPEVGEGSIRRRYRQKDVYGNPQRIRYDAKRVDLRPAGSGLPRIDRGRANSCDSVEVSDAHPCVDTQAIEGFSIESTLDPSTHSVTPVTDGHVDNIVARSHGREY